MYPDDIEVEEIEELEDGSAIMRVHLSMESLKRLAEIGLLKILEDTMNKLDETESTDIDTNVGC